MSTVEQAYQTQIQNIQKKTGKSAEELTALVKNSGLTKHSEIRDMLIRELGLGYGDANSLVHYILESDGERAAKVKGLSTDDLRWGGLSSRRFHADLGLKKSTPPGDIITMLQTGSTIWR